MGAFAWFFKDAPGYHFLEKFSYPSAIGIVSLPFSVSSHLTSLGLSLMTTGLASPLLSSSRSLMTRTLGVRPGIDLRIWLNLSMPLDSMFRKMWKVHFFPRTERSTPTGHEANELDVRS